MILSHQVNKKVEVVGVKIEVNDGCSIPFPLINSAAVLFWLCPELVLVPCPAGTRS